MSLSLAVRFDPAAAYPEVASLRAALAGRDWPACRALLDAARPADRTQLLRAGGEEPDLEGFLRAVLADDPADSTAAALLGFHLIRVAWRIRTGRRLRQVSRRPVAGFQERLVAAERVLIDAVARTPDDPALWVARLPSARGLGLGQAEARRRYARLAAIDQHHLPGQSQLVQQLCPKWGGSWDLMHAFAREATFAAPAGGPHAVLVVEGHLEHWLTLGEKAGHRYLAGDEVRAEIDAAARRSIFHPEFRRDIGWVRVMSTFAVLYGLLGDQNAAATTFTALDRFASEEAWSYFDNPASAVRRYRAAAFSPGARVLISTGRVLRRAVLGLNASGALR
jgi:hypothetical protein